ncbi:MAG: hypothetical protein M1120_01480 [Patescibacteria group bacterium]|nr:hypothetical protein [Patescibacteria group bacterium]
MARFEMTPEKRQEMHEMSQAAITSVYNSGIPVEFETPGFSVRYAEEGPRDNIAVRCLGCNEMLGLSAGDLHLPGDFTQEDIENILARHKGKFKKTKHT